jgi:hypothetical protein
VSQSVSQSVCLFVCLFVCLLVSQSVMPVLVREVWLVTFNMIVFYGVWCGRRSISFWTASSDRK